MSPLPGNHIVSGNCYKYHRELQATRIYMLKFTNFEIPFPFKIVATFQGDEFKANIFYMNKIK